jgi:hypothetical protein
MLAVKVIAVGALLTVRAVEGDVVVAEANKLSPV